MGELDPEIVERVADWCAEAGSRTTAAAVRAALAPLSWDELLAVKALLADPPPARPLGPHALVDIARGASPVVASELERQGRYPPAAGPASAAPAPGRRAPPAPGGARRTPAPVIRRARDRAPAPGASPAPALPAVDGLLLPEGRAVLERLLRRHGARRRVIAAEIGAGYARADGSRPDEDDLVALLAHHGLLRTFERREKEELLHALRTAGGVRAVAAERLALDVGALEVALERLGAAPEAARIREERRAELRSRATLAERVRLLLVDERRLADLGLLEEFERDVRARLPEHLRALRAGPEPLPAALRRSLALSRAAADALASRFDLDLGKARASKGAPGRAAAGGRPRRPGAPPGKRGPAPGGRRAGTRPRGRSGGRPGRPGRGR